VRRVNLYRDPASSGDPKSMTTPYGQVIEDFVADRILAELEVESDYRERRAGSTPSTPAAARASAAWRSRR
jgi:xanthine dehydrogenase large subunit